MSEFEGFAIILVFFFFVVVLILWISEQLKINHETYRRFEEIEERLETLEKGKS